MKEYGENIKGIEDLQNYLKTLYSDVNKKREWDYLYGYLTRSMGIVSRQVASAPWYRSMSSIDNTQFILGISWLFSLANYFDIDVVDSYLKKYPGICPYCVVAPCVCFKTNRMPGINIKLYKIEEERENAYRDTKRDVALIDSKWIISNIRKIYPANDIIWRHAGPFYHFTKLNEELAELHENISKYIVKKKQITAISQEIADISSWFFSIWSNVFNEITLEDAVIGYYYHGCPQCNSKPCKCPDRNSMSIDFIDVDSLIQIRNKLNDLDTLKYIEPKMLDDLKRTIEGAIGNQSEPRMVQAAQDTRDKLAKLNSSLDKVDEKGQKARTIIESILDIIEKSLRLFGNNQPKVKG